TVPKREVLPDPLYNSSLVTKFINSMTYGGKRQVSQAIMYDALNVVQAKTQEDPLKVFKRAVDNVKPSLEVKSRRVGGSNYQVPVEVNPARRTSLALRWIIGFARRRPERAPRQHHRHPRPRGFHGRGGALAAGAGRGGRPVRRGGRRAAAVGDRLASGRQIQGPAHRLHQQDGPGRRRFPALDPDHARSPPCEERRGHTAPVGSGGEASGRHRPGGDEGLPLPGRDAGGEVRGGGDPGRPQ